MLKIRFIRGDGNGVLFKFCWVLSGDAKLFFVYCELVFMSGEVYVPWCYLVFDTLTYVN